MPPNNHAVLSASSSHRWLNCNPSARLELEFEDRTTSAASEGTAAKAYAPTTSVCVSVRVANVIVEMFVPAKA